MIKRIATLAALLLIQAPALAGGTITLLNVNVVSVTDGLVAENQSIVIDGDMIVSVTGSGAHAPDGDQIDAGGAFAIPGLAEMHAHVPSRRRGEQYTRDMMALFLANGVTTIRGMLGEPWHLELKTLLETEEWDGPRLFTSGPSFNGNTVSSPEQGAARVAEQAGAGYDFLKIHPGLSGAEFIAVANAAKKAGIPIAGHVSHETGLDTALHHRQDCIDHLDGYAQAMVPEGSPLSGVAPQWFGLNLAEGMDLNRALALATQTALAGVWNVPTQSLFETTAGERTVEALLALPGMEYMSRDTRSGWQRTVEQLRAQTSAQQRATFLGARRTLIANLQDAGAGLLLGSDAPQIMNVPGFSVHEELRHLVNAGLTPLQALQTGTANVARYFGDTARGELAAGKVADLVLLEANPLDDISNTAGIRAVVRSGKFYDRVALNEILQGVQSRGL